MKRDAFTLAPDDVREIRHFHLFCGLGGGAKGFSGLLNETRSKTAKYQALNCLTLRGAWRAGFSPEQIALAIAAKQERNESRKWPDWPRRTARNFNTWECRWMYQPAAPEQEGGAA